MMILLNASFVDRQMEELKEGLNLSADQKKHVREILTAGSETMRKACEGMQDGGGDRDAMREKMQQMREEQNENIKLFLRKNSLQNTTRFSRNVSNGCARVVVSLAAKDNFRLFGKLL